MEHQDAIELLFRNIGALPDADFGSINLMPFSHSSDEVNALKRKVCQSIVGLLADNGHLATGETPAEPMHKVTMQCRMCNTTLLTFPAGNGGIANVPAASVIAALAKMKLECPHEVMTPDDQRRLIEEAVVESMKRGNPRDQ